MGHGRGIDAGSPVSASNNHLWRLWIAVALVTVTLITQVVVGLSTSSLALLSGSAHVFTDVFGILMAVVAIKLAQRRTTKADRTFGLHRAEVFAASSNAALLFAVAGWILFEAAQRISDPPEVAGVPVMAVATLGLIMNMSAFLLLRSGAKDSLNVRGAYLEVMADMLGSIGVLMSGLVTVLFGWRYADPIIGVAIGLFVLPRAYALGAQAVRILLQHAPSRLDLAGAPVRSSRPLRTGARHDSGRVGGRQGAVSRADLSADSCEPGLPLFRRQRGESTATQHGTVTDFFHTGRFRRSTPRTLSSPQEWSCC